MNCTTVMFSCWSCVALSSLSPFFCALLYGVLSCSYQLVRPPSYHQEGVGRNREGGSWALSEGSQPRRTPRWCFVPHYKWSFDALTARRLFSSLSHCHDRRSVLLLLLLLLLLLSRPSESITLVRSSNKPFELNSIDRSYPQAVAFRHVSRPGNSLKIERRKSSDWLSIPRLIGCNKYHQLMLFRFVFLLCQFKRWPLLHRLDLS